jgi:hypothetical protein
MSDQFHAPATLTPAKDNPPVPIGEVRPRASLKAVAKRKIPCPCWDSNSDRQARSLVAILLVGERRYSSTHSLNSALHGGEWSASRPRRFTPRERAPGTHWIGGWVGPRADLDAVVKRKIPSPCRDLKPRSSSP